MPDSIPRRQADLVPFLGNLHTRVTTTPAAYGIPEALLEPFTLAYNNFITSWNLLQNPATTTKAAREGKNEHMAEVVRQARHIIGIIQSMPFVSNEQRAELAIHIRDDEPTPVGPPTTKPLLTLTPKDARSVHVLIRDELAPDRRSKPSGVSAAAIFVHQGEEMPTHITQWSQWGSTTRTSLDISFPDAPGGATVWVVCTWMNPRLQTGPASTPVSVVLNSGGVVKAG